MGAAVCKRWRWRANPEDRNEANSFDANYRGLNRMDSFIKRAKGRRAQAARISSPRNMKRGKWWALQDSNL